MKKQVKKTQFIRGNMFCNSNDGKAMTLFCLMANDRIDNWYTSDNDDDDGTCTRDDEEEEDETEYDIPNEVRDFLSNYSKRSLMKAFILLD